MSLELGGEACGVFGLFGSETAAELTYFGLYALQHRGQESAGIVTTDGRRLYARKGQGEVAHVFPEPHCLDDLPGHAAIGHTRYSTTGANSVANIQPLLITFRGQSLAIGHNGNLTNSLTLKRYLERGGAIFQTTSDSELFLHLTARSARSSWVDMICDALPQTEGAYSALFIHPGGIIAARDPHGFRPLALGTLGSAHVIASETCAFDIIGARYVREIEPGEVVAIDADGWHSYRPHRESKPAFCIFEFIYFSRPDSRVFGENVDKVRRRLGRQLAREQPVDADFVISVPDSSNTAALGYSEESGIRYEIGLIRNHYVGRTFIEPEQHIRDLDVRRKFNPVTGVLSGKRVCVVDDSIVRGTTSRKLVKMLYEAGAREVHFRVSAPPIIRPCFYGIDMPSQAELIGSRQSIEEIRSYLGVDTLGYLSLEGLLSVPAAPEGSFCTACFSGHYPTPIEAQEGDKHVLEHGAGVDRPAKGAAE
jgi:amidophosphoribosyltransferase